MYCTFGNTVAETNFLRKNKKTEVRGEKERRSQPGK